MNCWFEQSYPRYVVTVGAKILLIPGNCESGEGKTNYYEKGCSVL